MENERQQTITVGLDGSPESLTAAHWAAREADRRGLGLRLIHVQAPHSRGRPRPGFPSEEQRRESAKAIIDAAQAELRQLHPRLPVTDELVSGEPEATLVGAASESRMLVLGSRGMHRFQTYFLGGTSLGIVARADSVVVLVRAGAESAEPGPHGPDGRVVVGIGLDHSYEKLLEFAFESAAACDLPVHAIHGRALPIHGYTPSGKIVPHVAREFRAEMEREISDVIRPWAERYPGVGVRGGFRLESPTQAVVQEATGSDLLVVGRSRRQRSPLGPRIGPVAHAAVHHAACPVAVVPHD